jgi:hypothetical protein
MRVVQVAGTSPQHLVRRARSLEKAEEKGGKVEAVTEMVFLFFRLCKHTL